jgi:hypothetical protein
MDRAFELSFDPNNKEHLKWLKNFTTGSPEYYLVNNPFGIDARNATDSGMYVADVFVKLARKFIRHSVTNKFGKIFSYENAYQMDGEYQKVRLLRGYDGYAKGTYFEYALVYRDTIDFYNADEDEEPALSISRF